MSPLRVVYVVGSYRNLTGSQRSLLALVRALPGSAVEPLAVFPGEGRCTAAFREAGVRVEVLPAPPELDRFGGVIPRAPWAEKARLAAWHLPRYARRFAALLARERADIVHFNELRALLLAGPGALLRSTPRVWHVRGDGRGLGAAWTLGAALADRTVCVADAVARTLPTWAQSRCRTVHNGIDVVADRGPSRPRDLLLRGVAPELPCGPGDLLVVVVGTLVPFKGMHHVVGAARSLELASPELASRVVIVHVGDAPEVAYRRQVVGEAAALARVRVRFVGWDAHPLDWMRAADVVVLPTVSRERLAIDGAMVDVEGTEGFPRTVLEAMACARPVVTTRVMGIPEQVEHGVTGVLCAPSSAGSLAAGLERVLTMSPEERGRLGAAGRRRVASLFTVERAVRGTLDVYRELVPRNARG